MIYSFTHPGSGLGNQLFRIVAGKVLALDKGYEYSAIGREHFKGKSFMNINFGGPLPEEWTGIIDPAGKIIVDDGFSDVKSFEEQTNYYNPEFNFIGDNTIIDGEFQDERYFGHRLPEINEWLKVEPLEIPDDVCIIGFRGGEFALFPELFLTKDYWDSAIATMRGINPAMKFEVHTDDPELAKTFFPDFYIVPNPRESHSKNTNMGLNWRSFRYAKYSIIANSSFFILPRLLNGGVTIAPRYWARRNTGEWSMPQNYYKSFWYI